MTTATQMRSLRQLLQLKDRRFESAQRSLAAAQIKHTKAEATVRINQKKLIDSRASACRERLWQAAHAGELIAGLSIGQVQPYVEARIVKWDQCVLSVAAELQDSVLMLECANVGLRDAIRHLNRLQAHRDGTREQYKNAKGRFADMQEQTEQLDIEDMVSSNYCRKGQH